MPPAREPNAENAPQVSVPGARVIRRAQRRDTRTCITYRLTLPVLLLDLPFDRLAETDDLVDLRHHRFQFTVRRNGFLEAFL